MSRLVCNPESAGIQPCLLRQFSWPEPVVALVLLLQNILLTSAIALWRCRGQRLQLGEWIQADLSELAGVETVARAIGEDCLDALLYMGGTWETHAFTPQYDFESCSDEDIARVIAVNLVAPIRLVKVLLPALRRSHNPKIVFMGALSGRDNFPAREVANSASKFGLRGVVHALREELRSQQIGVTVINPGNVGTPEVLADLAAANLTGGEAIPLSDLLAILDCVLSLARATRI